MSLKHKLTDIGVLIVTEIVLFSFLFHSQQILTPSTLQQIFVLEFLYSFIGEMFICSVAPKYKCGFTVNCCGKISAEK